MKRPAALLCGLSLPALLTLACGTTRVRSFPPPLEGVVTCDLKAPSAIRMGEPLPLTMTARNVTRETLRILTLGTPLTEGPPGNDFYVVICDGRRARYTWGILANFATRPMPAPGAYATVPPGGETGDTWDLMKYYGFTPGHCTIHYRGSVIADVIRDPKIRTRPPSKWRDASFRCPDVAVDVAP